MKPPMIGSLPEAKINLQVKKIFVSKNKFVNEFVNKTRLLPLLIRFNDRECANYRRRLYHRGSTRRECRSFPRDWRQQ